MEWPWRPSQFQPFFLADVAFSPLKDVTKISAFGYLYHQNDIFFSMLVLFIFIYDHSYKLDDACS